MKTARNIALFSLACTLPSTYAATSLEQMINHPISIGFLAGEGSTNWKMLSAYCQGDQTCEAMVTISAPERAKDKGLVWGVTAGYQIITNFGVALTYRRFHTTTIYFDANYGLTHPNNAAFSINSSVYSYSLQGRFYAPFFTQYYAYAAIGPTLTHRFDRMSNHAHINLSVETGLGAMFRKHWQASLVFFYASGYDHVNLTPAESYTPFLISVTANIAYHF